MTITLAEAFSLPQRKKNYEGDTLDKILIFLFGKFHFLKKLFSFINWALLLLDKSTVKTPSNFAQYATSPHVPTDQLIQWYVSTFLMNWPAASYS